MRLRYRYIVLLLLLGAGLQAVGKNFGGRELGLPVTPEQLPPLPDENVVPYGTPAGGLAMRIITPSEICPGQALSLTLQVKNVSEKDLYLPELFNPMFVQFTKLELKGPGGTVIPHGNSAQTVLTPQAYKVLKAGEIWRVDFANLREFYREAALAKEGEYSVTYSYTIPKIAAKMEVSERAVQKNGQNVIEKQIKDVSKEVQEGAWTGTVVANSESFLVRPMKETDLAVHEWGVFTVFNDLKYANVNRKNEWGDLPEFFYRQFPNRRLRWAPAAWDKPVIYFYTPHSAMKVGVKVKFAGGGAPVVWWPCAAQPVDQGMGNIKVVPGQAQAPLAKFDSLEWQGWLGKVVPKGDQFGQGPTGWSGTALTELPANSWLMAARLKEAAPITVTGSQMQQGRPWTTDRQETEGFIYYDGLVPSPDYLRCTATGSSDVSIKNMAKFKIRRMYVVDHRVAGKTAVASPRQGIEAGAETKVALSASDGGVPEAFVAQVKADLIDAGLYEAEAESVLKIWHKGLFENAGVVAFYLMPQSEYDRMLPLTITPTPEKGVIRVGIAFHPNFQAEPELAAQVETLLKQLDEDAYKTREAAKRALAGMGPMAVKMLQEAAEKSPSVNVRSAAAEILKNVDASEWLTAPAGTLRAPAPNVVKD